MPSVDFYIRINENGIQISLFFQIVPVFFYFGERVFLRTTLLYFTHIIVKTMCFLTCSSNEKTTTTKIFSGSRFTYVVYKFYWLQILHCLCPKKIYRLHWFFGAFSGRENVLCCGVWSPGTVEFCLTVWFVLMPHHTYPTVLLSEKSDWNT